MNGSGSKDNFSQENTAPSTFEEIVFERYPLLGSFIPREEYLQAIKKTTINAIEEKLGSSKWKFTDCEKMQMALSVINHAKDWDSKSSDPQDENEDQDNGFWAYIAQQYGYRDYKAIEKTLKETIYSVLKKYNKAFFVVSNKRRFRASVVAHAMAPKKSMMMLLELLFNFYKNNLDWNIVEGDPLLDVMIEVMQQRFDRGNSAADDMGVSLSGQMYNIQEGIKRLVLDYPDTARNLFEKLLKRIDDLINSRKCPVVTYEDQLCEEWYKEKLSEISESRSTVRGKKNGHRDIAVDYSKIRMKLVLNDEDDIRLAWPDIRLQGNKKENYQMTVKYGGSDVHHQLIDFYGSELGWSLEGGSISLPRFPEGLNTFDIQVQILCDDEEIFHDSILPDGTKVLFFSSDRQISAGSVKRDAYTLVAPDSVDVNIDCAEIEAIKPFKVSGLKAWFVELKEGYAVYADGSLLSFDHESDMNIRVMVSAEFSEMPEINVGQAVCRFAKSGSECFFAVPEGKARQYAILKNGEQLVLDDLSRKREDNEEIYPFQLTGENGICRIQVLDLGKNKEVYDVSFMLISHGEFVFNRDFYYAEEDWEKAELKFQIDDINETLQFGMAEDEITIPFRNGIIHVPVPKVTVEEIRGSWLNGAETVQYIENIPQESLIKVSSPPETEVIFFIDGQPYDGADPVDIGNKLMSFLGRENDDPVKIEMEIRGKRDKSRYLLAAVYLQEQFLVTPEFWAKGKKLYWNHGEKFGELFIGEPDKSFELTLTGKSGNCMPPFHLKEDSESLTLPDHVEDDVYQFEISVPGGYFDDEPKVLARGECAIGDPNCLRFLDRRIVIDSVTADEDEEGNSKHVQVKRCYIGNIRYEEIQDTSEGWCPVYSGTMYFEKIGGQKRYFSDREHIDKWGNKYMKVNPVRIIYLQDGVLCVTDPEGDGLYYKKLGGNSSENAVYEITDKEYTKEDQKDYSCADLYLYTTEEDQYV